MRILRIKMKNMMSKICSDRILDFISRLEPRIFLKKSKFYWRIEKISKKNNFNKDKIKFDRIKFNFGIVVQGPIVYEDNFTLETLKILRENYPNTKIVLSTWDDEKINEEYLKDLNIIFLKNKYPKKSIDNLNYQIISTKNGIIELKKYKIEYVLKMRTDQRIYNEDIDLYFMNLLKIYPLEKKESIQNTRIITTGMNTYKYRIYSINDMLQFGNILDLEKYWSVDLLERDYPKDNIKYYNAEIYLVVNFLKKIKKVDCIEYSLQEYYKVLSKNFIVIDSLSIYWYKYRLLDDKLSNEIIYENKKLTEVDWINLYSLYKNLNLKNIKKLESLFLEKLQIN